MARKKYKIKRTFDFRKLERRFPEIIADLLNTKAKFINDDIQNGIDLQVDIHGKPYAKMADSTRERKAQQGRGAKLLDDTGEMRKTEIDEAGPFKPTVKITAVGKNEKGEIYGAAHNEGIPGKLPKREWFGIPKESLPGGKDWKKANQTLVEMMRLAWKKHGL